MGKSEFSQANEHFRSGRFEKAVSGYEKIVIEHGGGFCVHENLGWAHEKLGQFDLAMVSYLRASALGGEPQRLEGLLKRALSTYISSRPLLSVVVPVHNTKPLVGECLKSIMAQTMRNLEILVVDDGSTDGSLEEINSLAAQDKRIRVIANYKASGSPGTPRNQALDSAKGVYVGFVDSDDWVEPDYFRSLLTKALQDNSDIVFAAGFTNVKGDKKEGRKYIQPLPDLPGYHESFMIWDKVFRRDLLDQHGIRLGNTPAAVDVPFILKAYFYLTKWSFCEGLVGYNYRRESASSVTVSRRRNSDCSFEIEAYRDAEKWSADYANQQYREIIAFRKVNSFIYTLGIINDRFVADFYQKVRKEFDRIDSAMVARLSKLVGKPGVFDRFNTIRGITSHSEYRLKYPVAADVVSAKSSATRFGFDIKAPKRGVLFFPDWTKTNPYQKLLYAALSGEYGIRIRGFSEGYFNREVLEKSRDNFDVIHLHWLHRFFDLEAPDGDAEIRRTLGFAKKLGYKLVYTAHNIISHDSIGPMRDREIAFRRKIVRHFDYIIAHGALAKQRLIAELSAEPSKIHVVEHGNYLGYYPNYHGVEESRARLGVGQDQFVFLFFGNIKGYKGVEPLLEAFERVYAKYPSCHLLVAGRIFDVQAREAIASAAEKMSIGFYPDYIADSDVQLYFNAADIVVLPYRRILTSGAAILSLSFSKPVIAPRSGLIPENTFASR